MYHFSNRIEKIFLVLLLNISIEVDFIFFMIYLMHKFCIVLIMLKKITYVSLCTITQLEKKILFHFFLLNIIVRINFIVFFIHLMQNLFYCNEVENLYTCNFVNLSSIMILNHSQCGGVGHFMYPT